MLGHSATRSTTFMTPQKQIPPERKKTYYIGIAVIVIGFICFISTMFSDALSSSGGPQGFGQFEQRAHSGMVRCLIGSLMIIAGFFMVRIGRMGLAGSGIKLDPEQGRRDVEPWARMAGGVVKDAIDEAGIKMNGQSSGEELPFDERLRRLQKLRQDGLVSEQEYEATKKKILENA